MPYRKMTGAALALSTALLAAPLAAQETQALPETATLARTWQIFLATGDVIEFRGQVAWSGTAKGPAQFLADYEAFLSGGATPPIMRYSFPPAGSATERAAEVVIDLRQVVAVVQKF